MDISNFYLAAIFTRGFNVSAGCFANFYSTRKCLAGSKPKDPKIHLKPLVCRDVRCFKYSKADACILALKSRLTHKSLCLSLGRCLERLMFHGSTVQQLTTSTSPYFIPTIRRPFERQQSKAETVLWYKSLHILCNTNFNTRNLFWMPPVTEYLC